VVQQPRRCREIPGETRENYFLAVTVRVGKRSSGNGVSRVKQVTVVTGILNSGAGAIVIGTGNPVLIVNDLVTFGVPAILVVLAKAVCRGNGVIE